jgi:hypothetical protein
MKNKNHRIKCFKSWLIHSSVENSRRLNRLYENYSAEQRRIKRQAKEEY